MVLKNKSTHELSIRDITGALSTQNKYIARGVRESGSTFGRKLQIKQETSKMTITNTVWTLG